MGVRLNFLAVQIIMQASFMPKTVEKILGVEMRWIILPRLQHIVLQSFLVPMAVVLTILPRVH